MKKVLYVFLIFSDFIFELFKIKRNKIVISTFSPEVYCDNSKYLFEYLSKKKMDVYWFTNSIKIKNYLKKKKFKYISYSNIFHLLKVALQTKIVIDSGSNYFNCFNFFDRKKIIKISLGHGMGNKMVVAKYISTKNYEYYEKFNYVNYTSKYSIKHIAKGKYKLPDRKILNFGYPRVAALRNNEKINKKKEIKKIFFNYQKEKVIFYTPTWRPYKYNLPILELDGFKIEKFNSFLKKNNLIFFFSVHNAVIPIITNKLFDQSNIIFIDRKKLPFFDTTYFLNFVDLLINDCSTTSTEFALLKKPQLFLFPDYKRYLKIKGFVHDYFNELPGKSINNTKKLEIEIINYINKEKKYKIEFKDKINENLLKYYDNKNLDSNKKFYQFIKTI
jgi:CDP-glycerol glycerophosphotransferase (TagB/SpsB family)